MDYPNFAGAIIELRDTDFALRNMLIENGKLGSGYNDEMKELHDKNAEALDKIIDEIGYPTVNKVGEEASEAAWLVIQHAIGKPLFMKKCLHLLETQPLQHQSNRINIAYLTDRIASFEGEKQYYGTQFDWDENGKLSPIAFDDLAKVNERRRSLGLNTLKEQILVMRKRVSEENQTPPVDFEQYKRDAEDWKKSVGWRTQKP